VLNIVFDLAGVVVRYDQAALLAKVFPDPMLHATVRKRAVERSPNGVRREAILNTAQVIISAPTRPAMSRDDTTLLDMADAARLLHTLLAPTPNPIVRSRKWPQSLLLHIE
jgi:hypothetical protein